MIKIDYPCEDVGSGNTCFRYKDRVCSVHSLHSRLESILGVTEDKWPPRFHYDDLSTLSITFNLS